MKRGLVALALTLLACDTRSAAAQSARPARLEVSGGVRWIGPIDFGSVDANEATIGNGTRPLFSAKTTLDGSVGANVGVSVRVARSLRAEGAMSFNPTGLSTHLTGDLEGTANTIARAPVTQFLVEGGVLAEGRRHGHFTPFITGGLGYLRQLNDGRTLVETGRSFYLGGGLYYVRTSARPRRVKATGARVDVRAVFLRDGVAPDGAVRGAPAVTAAFFARF